MKRILFAVSTLGLLACGTPDMSGTGGGGGSQTCTYANTCRNGSCTCDDGPNKDSSCCSPSDSTCTTNKCDTYCKYCR